MIHEMIRRQRPGWSLEQAFYVDPSIYALETERWFPRQWMVMAHVSELPARGSYVVRQLFGNDIVIANAGDGNFRAYHNTCTHRGSRICKDDGRAALLVCPYHAWSFRLTGELQSARDVPEGVDPGNLSLHGLACREVGGFIFCGLDEPRLPDLDPLVEALRPGLLYHGLDRARIAARRSYPTAANWKLVLENFYECYHCRPSHPEYFRANGHVKVTAISDAAAAGEWQAEENSWIAALPDLPHNRSLREPGDGDAVRYARHRRPIGLGRKTQSRDGRPVAPLMGGFTEYDGGETSMHLGRFGFIGAYNDHAVLFQFMPRAPEMTEVVETWLVDETADLAKIDEDALTFLWDVTTRQDQQIVEENAIGIRSCAYRPGPYTALESQTAGFVADYLANLGKAAA